MVGRRLLESFLRLCGFSWRAFSRAEGVTLPAPISDLERLSRYITDQGHFNAPKETIHFRAFLPRRQDQDLSIMRTDQLTEAAVWTLGDQEVGEPSGRAISARGDFVAPSVREAVVDPWALTVEPSEPPVRHALIVGRAARRRSRDSEVPRSTTPCEGEVACPRGRRQPRRGLTTIAARGRDLDA